MLENLPKLEEVKDKSSSSNLLKSTNQNFLKPQEQSDDEKISVVRGSIRPNIKLNSRHDIDNMVSNSTLGDINSNDLTVQNLRKPNRPNFTEQESDDKEEKVKGHNMSSSSINNSIKKNAIETEDNREKGNKSPLNQDEHNKLLENFKMMLSSFKPNVNIKNEDVEKAKLNEELTAKLEYLERERNNFTKQFQVKENGYFERIHFLENQLGSFDKVDLNMLKKQNKDYENQFSHLTKVIGTMNAKHSKEKHKFNNIVAEVMVLKERLIEEIKNMEILKRDVMMHEGSPSKKVELVLKKNDSFDDKLVQVTSRNDDHLGRHTNETGEYKNSVDDEGIAIKSDMNRGFKGKVNNNTKILNSTSSQAKLLDRNAMSQRELHETNALNDILDLDKEEYTTEDILRTLGNKKSMSQAQIKPKPVIRYKEQRDPSPEVVSGTIKIRGNR